MSARDDFFIGWEDRVPRWHRKPLALAALAFLAGLLLLALGLARTIDDAGDGHGDWAAGEQSLTGVVTTQPYALLHLPADAAHPRPHTMMLSVVGKYPVVLPEGWDGRTVTATGWVVRRGALDMVQMTAPPVLAPRTAPAPEAVEPLGRWRLTGEICDGQCYAGLMRPGTGIAHRACADFCLAGGVPPVFVTTAPVRGQSFLVMANAAGGPVGREMVDYVGLRVRLDGAVERHGDMLVFKADFATAVVP